MKRLLDQSISLLTEKQDSSVQVRFVLCLCNPTPTKNVWIMHVPLDWLKVKR